MGGQLLIWECPLTSSSLRVWGEPRRQGLGLSTLSEVSSLENFQSGKVACPQPRAQSRQLRPLPGHLSYPGPAGWPHGANCYSSSQAIENIDTLTSLESLFLGKNKITKLQNLDALTNLTVLSMQVLIHLCSHGLHPAGSRSAGPPSRLSLTVSESTLLLPGSSCNVRFQRHTYVHIKLPSLGGFQPEGRLEKVALVLEPPEACGPMVGATRPTSAQRAEPCVWQLASTWRCLGSCCLSYLKQTSRVRRWRGGVGGCSGCGGSPGTARAS